MLYRSYKKEARSNAAITPKDKEMFGIKPDFLWITACMQLLLKLKGNSLSAGESTNLVISQHDLSRQHSKRVPRFWYLNKGADLKSVKTYKGKKTSSKMSDSQFLFIPMHNKDIRTDIYSHPSNICTQFKFHARLNLRQILLSRTRAFAGESKT
jgi:hypothetical protein